MPRPDLFAVLEYLVVAGQPEGRVAAAQALAGYREPEADALFAAWLSHEDPEVRAVAVGQVRPRRGAEAVGLLIGMLDQRDPPVLAAIREALPEFSLPRFLVRLKDMPPAARSGVGRLVAKLADDPVGYLRKDLENDVSHVRVRAAQAVGAMGLASEVQEQLIVMAAEDPDKFVRAACAEALAQGLSVESQAASRRDLGRSRRRVAPRRRSGTGRQRVCRRTGRRLAGRGTDCGGRGRTAGGVAGPSGRHRGGRHRGGIRLMDTPVLAVAIFLTLALAAAAWIVRKRKLAARGLSPHAIFLGLCRVHGLDKATRKLLHRFARRIKCPQPARLFVNPALLDRAAAAGLPAKDVERLQALYDELFAEPSGFALTAATSRFRRPPSGPR